MGQDLWYAGGLRFSCARCSACCRGEEGYVFLSAADTRALADALGMGGDAFSRAYCRLVAGGGETRLSLKEKSGGDCVLWKNGCSVYAARPTQCRTYPFWPSALASEEAWNQATAACPGAGAGVLRDAAYIRRVAAREDANCRRAADGAFMYD